MEKIEIEDVQRLNVQPGDVLVITVPQDATPQQVQDIKNLFETTLPIRVLVKTSHVQMEIVHDGPTQ